MTAGLPLAHIDHVRVSADVQAVSARAVRGVGSDHRLVVVDLIVGDSGSAIP